MFPDLNVGIPLLSEKLFFLFVQHLLLNQGTIVPVFQHTVTVPILLSVIRVTLSATMIPTPLKFEAKLLTCFILIIAIYCIAMSFFVIYFFLPFVESVLYHYAVAMLILWKPYCTLSGTQSLYLARMLCQS